MNPQTPIPIRRRWRVLYPLLSTFIGGLVLLALFWGLRNPLVHAAPSAAPYIDANYAHDWVNLREAGPNTAVTVTVAGKAVVTGTTDGNGEFSSDWGTWNPNRPDIAPGDVITTENVSGTLTINPVGVITGTADYDADTVTGAVNAAWFSPTLLTVSCAVWEAGAPAIDVPDVNPDGGSFFCDFAGTGWDLQPDQMLAIMYTEPDGDLIINVIEAPWVRVQAGHDWVGANYEVGHTFWITVTDSASAVKATAQIDSRAGGGWGGDGFETNPSNWTPRDLDITAGDWVYFQADDGYTNTVHVGDISGTIDINNDNISGPINASWFTETLNVECHPWGGWEAGWGNAHVVNSTAAPDGSSPYTCQWDPITEWDVEPGQDIAVFYTIPGSRDLVGNVFQEPAPHLGIDKGGEGEPGEGGNFVFTIQYINQGNAVAENVVITDTMLGGMTYISDTSGFPHTGSGSGPIIWNLGDVSPGRWVHFRMFVEITAAAGEQITNTAVIATSTPYDQGEPEEKYSEWSGQVQPNDTHLGIDKYPWTGDPAVGGEFVWTVNACNNGSTASSQVALTDTLPISTTLLGWQGQNPGWTETYQDNSTLALSYPSLPAGWCSEVYLRFQVDAAWPGMSISNTAVITAANDLESDDNMVTSWIDIGDPHTNLAIYQWWSWGQLVPGGEIHYSVQANNTGNTSVNNVLITNTLPANTSLLGVIAMDRSWDAIGPVTPTVETPDYVVWEIGTLDNGYAANYELQLLIDADAAPGTILTNTLEISPQPDEDDYDDNADSWTETVYDHGPNLRLRKFGQWNDWGENTRRASYWLNIENVGDAPVSPVVITDTYGSGGMYLDGGIDADYWDWWEWNDLGGYFTITLTVLNSGDSVGVNFGVITDTEPLPFGLIFTNTAEVITDPTDSNPDDNSDSAILTTGPDLYVNKEMTAGNLLPGELITFSLSFGNDRRGYEWWWGMQGDAWLTDTLPAELEFVSAERQSCGWCDAPPDAVNGREYAWNVGRLDAAVQDEIRLTARIVGPIADGDILTNTAEIASSQPASDTEPYYDDNSDSYTAAITLPRFEISKAYESSRVAGTTVTYTLTITNAGSLSGTAVAVSDTLPANITYAGGDGALTGGDVLWTFANIASGETAVSWFSGVLTCTAGATVLNDAYAVTDSGEGVASLPGNPVSFDILAPTLTAAFEQSAVAVKPGESVIFTSTSATNGTPIVSWAWDFGDGAVAAGATANHSYTTPGDFDVTLTVTDGCGYTDVITGTVTVTRYDLYLPVLLKP
jgi:uncharacterized repeat protein (TIGR01451 family)